MQFAIDGKTNHGIKLYGHVAQHVNISSCPVGSIGFYLFYCFYITKEFEDNKINFFHNKSWFDIKFITQNNVYKIKIQSFRMVPRKNQLKKHVLRLAYQRNTTFTLVGFLGHLNLRSMKIATRRTLEILVIGIHPLKRNTIQLNCQFKSFVRRQD